MSPSANRAPTPANKPTSGIPANRPPSVPPSANKRT
jgi:hypothetical protein